MGWLRKIWTGRNNLSIKYIPHFVLRQLIFLPFSSWKIFPFFSQLDRRFFHSWREDRSEEAGSFLLAREKQTFWKCQWEKLHFPTMQVQSIQEQLGEYADFQQLYSTEGRFKNFFSKPLPGQIVSLLLNITKQTKQALNWFLRLPKVRLRYHWPSLQIWYPHTLPFGGIGDRFALLTRLFSSRQFKHVNGPP